MDPFPILGKARQIEVVCARNLTNVKRIFKLLTERLGVLALQRRQGGSNQSGGVMQRGTSDNQSIVRRGLSWGPLTCGSEPTRKMSGFYAHRPQLNGVRKPKNQEKGRLRAPARGPR